MPPNGAADWPDVRCAQMCPVCGKLAIPNGQTECYMLVETLWQVAADQNTSTLTTLSRMVNRLTCKPCMASLLNDCFMIQNNEEALPMMQVLENHLPIIPLLDYESNPICQETLLEMGILRIMAGFG